MLNVPGAVRIFLCTQPTDMRKSFDGLMGLTSEVLEQDPLSGHLFLFVNRRKDRLKILYWDRDGLAIWYKRLEAGTFEIPHGDEPRVELDAAALNMLLAGIAWQNPQRRKRYQLAG